MLARLSSETSRGRVPSSCRAARSEFVILSNLDKDHRKVAVDDGCEDDVDHELQSCTGLVSWRFIVLIMASVGVHQIEKVVADVEGEDQNKSAVNVVDVDVVIDVDGRLEQPRSLLFNC